MSGHIRAARDLFEPDHKLAGTEVCRRFAWLDLIQMAAWKPCKRIIGSTVIPLARGEFMASYSFLAVRWGWSEKRVRTFVDGLKSDRAIDRARGTPKGTVYRVVNYDTYQAPGQGEGHSEGHPKGQGRGRARAGSKEVKKLIQHSLTRGRAENSIPEQPPRLPIVVQEKADGKGLDLDLVWIAFRGHYEASPPGRNSSWTGLWQKWVSNEILRGQRLRRETNQQPVSKYD